MSQPDVPTATSVDSATGDVRKPPFDFDALPYAAAIVWLACVLLALACNGGSFLGREWIWTDNALVAQNPLIGMLNGLQRVWSDMFHPDRYGIPQFSPLSQTMFFFERALFGQNPAGYRIVSAVLHGSCAGVLYLLLRGLKLRGALFVALLFVVHPVMVDSVSFLTERRNVLGGLFGLSALYMLFRAAGAIALPAGKVKLLPDDPARLYAMGAALLVVGLFAQPAIAPLGLVAMLVIWARHAKSPAPLALIAIGVAVLGAVLLSVSSRVELAHSGYTQKQWERAPTPAGEIAVRTQVAGRAVFFYLQKSLLPFPLAMDYGRWMTPNDLAEYREVAPDVSKDRFATRSPDVGADQFIAWLFPLAAVAVLVALAALSKQIGRTPIALAASFVLLLAPFLGFIDLGWMQASFVSHRAMYLATIPILVGLVLAITPLLSDPSQRVSLIASQAIVMILMIRLAVGLSARYQYNLSFWRESDIAANPRQSFLNVLTRTPWYSRYQAATWLIQYQPSELEKSLSAYNDVLERGRPGNSEVLVQLGRVLTALHQDQEAMNRFAFVMQNDPDFGLAFRSAGDLMKRQADAAPTNPAPRMAALELYDKAAKADPLDATARILLAQTAWEVAKRLPNDKVDDIKARMQQAAEAFDAADEIRPYDVGQLMVEARTLMEMQLLPAAASRLTVARAVEPQNPEVLLLIADLANLGGQWKGAESAYRHVLELDEKYVEAYTNYSAMLATQERFDEAQELLDKGLKLLPDDPKLLDAVKKLKEFREKAATRPASTQP